LRLTVSRRLQEDIGEDDWINSEEQTFWQGAKLAFTDSKTYILVRREQPQALTIY
jgi:hypothetical protein